LPNNSPFAGRAAARGRHSRQSGWRPDIAKKKTASLTERNHLNAPSFGRHHTLAEERAFIVTGRDSVPVAISITRSIVVGVSIVAHGPVAAHVAAHDDGGASFVEASTVEAVAMEVATASTIEAAAPDPAALSRSRVLS
jgi:hypothetical protein